ncbi:hypothetical protein ALI22I_16530 [Saccharothrix sp. ALI-22-I]|nr:hypothetical protein ALI22I_16530 [Saccharothrix sp. ALI-22-I]
MAQAGVGQAAPVVQRTVAGPTGARAGRPVLGLGRPVVGEGFAPAVRRPVASEFEFVQREVEVSPPPPSASSGPGESAITTAAPEPIPAVTAVTAMPEAGAAAGQAGVAAGQAGVAGQAAAGAQEPEELLKKLYDPLVRRLKAELWLDRERRGALTDRWR